MGILVNYFVETDDARAAAFIDFEARPEFEIDGRQVEPSVSLAILEEHLGGREFHEILEDDTSFSDVADDDDRSVVALGATFEDVLLAASSETVSAAVQHWSHEEEMSGSDPADLTEFLDELRSLVQRARASAGRVYARSSP